ncbi:MAG: type II secretion system F family protein [Magnetococcales bacterium]|nr:type II secretion system F family protein [Magnetococcales bacterium]NGZ26600.1 type II secretion system F family protein [Magnetococcales bacterium]
MGYFRYKQIDAKGKVQGGLIQLPFTNPASAITYLEGQGGTVIYAYPLNPQLGTILSTLQEFTSERVTRDQLAEGLNNLAVMLKAGMPLLTALRDSLAKHDNPTLARVGRELVQRIENGSSLSEAFSQYPTLFPETLIYLTRLGEESGALDRTIRDAANHEKRSSRIMQEARSALIYPAFMLTAILAAAVFWLVYVIPQISAIFVQMKMKLPAFTLFVMSVATTIQNWLFPIVIALALSIFALVISLRESPQVRWVIHSLLLKLPVVGVIVSTANIAFIAEYFALMLNAGVDVLRSLDILSQSLTNEVYRQKLASVRSHLIQGTGLHHAFAQADIFPPFVVRMVGVGEQSGSLAEQLSYVADDFRIRLEQLVTTISKSIEPIALTIGGLLFALLAAALFMPIYSLLSNLSGGRGGGL